MDWRTWALGILGSVTAYLLTRESSRKDRTEDVVAKLSEAVIALQQAVKGLEKFSDAHDRTMDELQKEFRVCQMNCPLRGEK